MAATAYASLVSLLNNMDNINIHPFLSTCFEKYPMKTLGEKLEFFLDFVENHPDPDSVEAEDLFTQIADVVRTVEDRIEVEAADLVRYGSAEQSPSVLADLHKRIEEMDVIKEKVIHAKEESGFKTRQPTSSMPPPSSSDPLANSKTTTMVGFDGYLEQLLDQLTGYPSTRLIIPIVGMGGIGKTTLALNAYKNSLTLNHFDIRAWVTVSQKYTTTKLLSEAISCLGRSTGEMNSNDVQLGEILSKTLYGRRYLMVLDDMWSVDAWEKIMFYFPENNNGSRIVLTTRQSQVVDYFGSSALFVNFLNHKYSWELFCEKAFAEKSCPPELEEVGKKIVDKCEGLPLIIIVIAGLLRKSSVNREYWEEISKDTSLILDSGEGNEPLSILYLSYKHLPICMRPCLLYFAILPEDYTIKKSELIDLWVAEGFIKQKKDQCLEDVAESHLEELIRRNLLLVDYVSDHTKRFSMFRVHDLVRDLCTKIAKKENLFCVQRDLDGEFIVSETVGRYYLTSTLVRPLVFHEQRSRLMRVLHTQFQLDNLGFSLRQVNLRYLSLSSPKLSLSISLLWSLQTLIISVPLTTVVAPHEIWKMPMLRHIEALFSIYIPDPSSCDDALVLRNLQALDFVKNLNFTEEVCKRIPNVKVLCIEYKGDEQGEVNPCYNLHNVSCLYKLESLYYRDNLWRNMKLPSSLRELTLHGCRLVWSDMVMISLLPNLEILILLENAVVGVEWNCLEVEKGFHCLKHLQIDECDDLIHWIADASNFPVLARLKLSGLSILEEVPWGIGEIPTLEWISMYSCSESSNISAIYMLEELESVGNHSMRLSIKTAKEKLRDKITELGITCQNLWINGRHIRFDD